MAQKDKYLELNILNKDYTLYNRMISVTTDCSYVTILGQEENLFQLNTLI